MSQPAAVASASLARWSPRCQAWSSRPRLPSGFSRLWSGPATKPSSEIDMWQVVSGIGVLPRRCSALAERLERGVLLGNVAADHGRKQREQHLQSSSWTEVEFALELGPVIRWRERTGDREVRLSARLVHKP